jgi:SAM-dependent methyltransferase
MLIDRDALRMVREHELEMLAGKLPPGGKILEIGGGAGWQAAELARRGMDVTSVDLAGNPYAAESVWPVMEYDGRNLPFADSSFDAVFSSNVLEHVEHVEELLAEISRVVRPGGVSVHLMPTPAWRLLTILTHYPWLVLMTLRGVTGRRGPVHEASGSLRGRSWLSLVRSLLFASHHGARGNVLTEVLLFSPRHWRRRLIRDGSLLESDRPAGIAYSGYFVTHPWMTKRARCTLSQWLGSGSHLYVLRRPGETTGGTVGR